MGRNIYNEQAIDTTNAEATIYIMEINFKSKQIKIEILNRPDRIKNIP